MKFGPVPLTEAEGAVLAHSMQVGDGCLCKGQALDAEHVAAIQSQGIDDVIVARLDAGDVDENAAASVLAAALVPDPAAAALRVTEPLQGGLTFWPADPAWWSWMWTR